MNDRLVFMLSTTHVSLDIGETDIVTGLCLTAHRNTWVTIVNPHTLRACTLALPPHRSAGQRSCPLLCSYIRCRYGVNRTHTHADHP